MHSKLYFGVYKSVTFSQRWYVCIPALSDVLISLQSSRHIYKKNRFILEYPLSRLLCSYNTLDCTAMRCLSSDAVIGFGCLLGFKPVS